MSGSIYIEDGEWQSVNMAINPKIDARSGAIDKRLLQQSVAALQARLGLSHEPHHNRSASAAGYAGTGLKPEDCLISTEIVCMRLEEKEQSER